MAATSDSPDSSGADTDESNDDADDVPSNVELAQRTARVEEKIDAQADTLGRIETALVEDHEDLADQVEQNDRRVTPVYTAWRFGKYALPVLGTLIGSLGGLAATGVI